MLIHLINHTNLINHHTSLNFWKYSVIKKKREIHRLTNTGFSHFWVKVILGYHCASFTIHFRVKIFICIFF